MPRIKHLLQIFFTYDIHFGPLLQLLFKVAPRHFGLKPQRVSCEVDTFPGAVNQREIGCTKNTQASVSKGSDSCSRDDKRIFTVWTHNETGLQFWAPGICPGSISGRRVHRGMRPPRQKSDRSPARLKLASGSLPGLSHQTGP